MEAPTNLTRKRNKYDNQTLRDLNLAHCRAQAK